MLLPSKLYLAEAGAVWLYTTSAVSLAGLLTEACRVVLWVRLVCGSGLLLLSVLRSVLCGSACSNVKKLLKYDRKQLILSHMYSPSEMCFECRRCSMKNLFLKTHSLIEKCTKIISYLMDNVS